MSVNITRTQIVDPMDKYDCDTCGEVRVKIVDDKIVCRICGGKVCR